jgi:putative hemolysin
MTIRNLVILLAGAFLLDLFFNLIRASMLRARLPYLGGLRQQYPRRAERTLLFLERPHLATTLRLGVVLAHFLLAGLSVLLAFELVKDAWSLGLAVLVLLIAALIIMMIEFTMEGWVMRKAELWALRLTPLARLVDGILRPFSWLLMRMLGKPDTHQRTLGDVTDDELKTWVEAGQPEGSLERGERRMIYSIFQFGDKLCREIMVPRIDVFSLDAETTVQEAITMIKKYGHSRMPVYEGAVDNVIGLLYAKDLLGAQEACSEPIETIRSLVRQAYFVPEAKKVDELLREMQAQSVHIAIVIDEYGGVAGLVTLEDIVEEIIGEIRDEYDQSEEHVYEVVGTDEYIFLGRTDLDEFNEVTGAHFTKEVADTLGGLIYAETGRVPVGGEQITAEGWVLTVEQVLGRRIRRVHVRRQTQENPAEEEKNENG